MKTPYNNILSELAKEEKKDQSMCNLQNYAVVSAPKTSHGRNSGHPLGDVLGLGGPS